MKKLALTALAASLALAACADSTPDEDTMATDAAADTTMTEPMPADTTATTTDPMATDTGMATDDTMADDTMGDDTMATPTDTATPE